MFPRKRPSREGEAVLLVLNNSGNLLFEQLEFFCALEQGLEGWQGGAYVHFMHSVISVQTHPNLALLEVFWAELGGEDGRKSLLTSYKPCSVREQQAGHPERLILSTTAVWKLYMSVQAAALPDHEATVSNLCPFIQITFFTSNKPALVSVP